MITCNPYLLHEKINTPCGPFFCPLLFVSFHIFMSLLFVSWNVLFIIILILFFFPSALLAFVLFCLVFCPLFSFDHVFLSCLLTTFLVSFHFFPYLLPFSSCLSFTILILSFLIFFHYWCNISLPQILTPIVPWHLCPCTKVLVSADNYLKDEEVRRGFGHILQIQP